MNLEGMIEYAEEMVEVTTHPMDKTRIYQILLWLQELKDFRETYEAEKDWNKIDESTESMIQENIHKRGKL